MIRRPPRSTRTDTFFPYPTLFRSAITSARFEAEPAVAMYSVPPMNSFVSSVLRASRLRSAAILPTRLFTFAHIFATRLDRRFARPPVGSSSKLHSEERWVGEEGASTGQSQRSSDT